MNHLWLGDGQCRSQLVFSNLMALLPCLSTKRGSCCRLLDNPDAKRPSAIVLNDRSLDHQRRVIELPPSIPDPGRTGDDEVIATEHVVVCVEVSEQHPTKDGRPCALFIDLVPVDGSFEWSRAHRDGPDPFEEAVVLVPIAEGVAARSVVL